MNKEQTEKSEVLIHIREDGSVRISGGFIVHRSYIVQNDSRVDLKHVIENNAFYMELPRWWQLFQWIKLIRLLHSYTDPVDTKEKTQVTLISETK